jgi:hypothetical protein
MVQRHVRQLLAVAFAISIFTAMSAAPVAASGGLGSDDGVDFGSDGLFGGDDADGDEEDADISVGDQFDDESTEESDDSDDGGGTSLGSSSSGDAEADSIDGGLEDLSLEFGNLSSDGDGFDGIGGDDDEAESEVDVPSHPTDIEFDSDDIPEDQRPFTQFLQSLPETNETGPEDFPIGDDRALINICDSLDIEADDLPIGLIPGPGEILPEALQLPGLPWDLITPEALIGILLGFIPAPCEIFNPNDPQIDPTDPPDDPRAQFDVARWGEQDGGAVGLVTYEGTLNDSGVGPSIEGKHGTLLTPEYGDIDHELILNDGKNDLGLDTRIRYNENRTSFEAVLVLLGKRAGIDVNCKTLENYDGNLITLDFEELEENPLGPCDYELIGLPNLIGPGDLFGIVNDLADNDEPIIDPFAAVPINLDALLNL